MSFNDHLIWPQAVQPNVQMGGYANNAFVNGPTVPGNMFLANQVRFCVSFTDWNNFHLNGLKTRLYTLPPDGWAGAENRNVTDRPTNRPTRQVLESRVHD